MVTPLVVMLDLDGTIIGDIRPQITTYDISNQIKSHGAKLKYTFSDYKMKLNGGIIRPSFSEFINRLKKDVPFIEFFIYTASEKKWASHIISHIEKACSIKINRPLFTRKDCIVKGDNLLKSLAKVKPQVLRVLKKKYGIMDLTNKILIIDNSPVFIEQDTPYHILCKTYNFVYPENLGAIISHEEYCKHQHIIDRILSSHLGVGPGGGSANYFDFQKRFYDVYCTTLKDVIDTNKDYEKDTFFKDLRRAITKLIVVKKHLRFDSAGVSYIRRQLDKKSNVVAFY
jgi:hypothetical protein